MVALALALAAGGAQAVVRRDLGGDVVVAVPAGPAASGPAAVTTLAGAIWTAAVYDTLYVDRGSAAAPEPLLAAGPPEPLDAVAAGKVWRIPLRPGVFFHDSAPLDADAVIRSLARLAAPAPAAPHAWLLAPVKGLADVLRGKRDVPSGLRAESSGAVVVELVRPSDPVAVARWLAAPALAITGAERAGRPPAGTGPFRPAGEPAAGAPVKLVAFARHARGRPFLDSIVLAPFAARKDALAAFVIGDVQLSLFGRAVYGSDAAARADAETGAALADVLLLGPARTGRKVLAASDFRAGVERAIDRAAVAGFALGAGALPAAGLVPPVYPFGRIATPAKSDAKSARDLLTGAAARAGEPLPALKILLSAARPHHRDVADKLVVALRAAGLDVELAAEAHAVFLVRRAAGDYDLCLDEVWLPGGGDLALPGMLAALGRGKDAAALFAAGTHRDLKTALEVEKRALGARDGLVLDFRPLRAYARTGLRGVWFDAAARLHLEDAFWAAPPRAGAEAAGAGAGAGPAGTGGAK